MKGKLIQLCDSLSEEPEGIIYCEDENVDTNIIGFHWVKFCESNLPMIGLFLFYLRDKVDVEFTQVHLEEIYN